MTTKLPDESARVPGVSVVIPSYNRLRSLPRALQSVLRQTFEDIEVIVVDDCSTDGTWDYLQTIHDPRLRIIRHETNKGGGAAQAALALFDLRAKYAP